MAVSSLGAPGQSKSEPSFVYYGAVPEGIGYPLRLL